MQNFKSKYTDSLEECLEIAQLAMEKDPGQKENWDELYRQTRHELYKTKGKIMPLAKKRLDKKCKV